MNGVMADARDILVTYEPVNVSARNRDRSGGSSRLRKDDLTRIEGVGPKMSQALHAAGIDTFAKIAATDEDELRAAVEAAGMRLAPSIPTWRKQAEFAMRDDWDGLAAYQDQLVAGRER